MSDDADVERLLENFQKALETVDSIGNVEALITKLDFNKNRKLLKRVKHVVGEVHNKVGIIKEKVSKAYKRVKIRSSSESEEVIDNVDKVVGDRTRDAPIIVNEEDRYSPIISGRGKFKRFTRQTEKSQKNKNTDASNVETVERMNKMDDINVEDEKNDIEDMDNSKNRKEQIDAGSNSEAIDDENIDIIEGTPEKPANKISIALNKNNSKNDVQSLQDSDDDLDKQENNIDANEDNKKEESSGNKAESAKDSDIMKSKTSTDNNNKSDSDESEKTDKKHKKRAGKRNNKKDKQIDNNIYDEKESDNESESNGTDKEFTESSGKKNKHKNKKIDNDILDEGEGDTKSDGDEAEQTVKKLENSSGKNKNKEINSDISDEGEHDNKSDSDEAEETDKELKKSSGEKNKAIDSDISDEGEGGNKSDCDGAEKTDEELKKPSAKKNKKIDSDISGEWEGDNKSDSEEAQQTDDELKKSSGKKDKKKSDSDEAEQTDEEDKKSSGKNDEMKNKKIDNTISDEGNDDTKSDSDEAEKIDKELKKSSCKKVKKKKKIDNDISDEEDGDNRSDSEEVEQTDKEPKKWSGKKNNKNNKQIDNDTSDDGECDKSNSEESDGNVIKSSGKKDKNKKKRKDGDISDEEQDKMKDTPKKAGSGRNKSSKDKEQPKDVDTDDSETVTKSLDQYNSSEDEIVTIEDTPQKVIDKKNTDEKNASDSEGSEPKTNDVSIKSEEDKENQLHLIIPRIKLVDISKLLAPNNKALDIMTPSPKTKKSVTFDSSVIILSSSDEETPKKDPKTKDQNPLKSAMRKSSSKENDSSDTDSKENNENLIKRKDTRRNVSENKIVTSDYSSDDSQIEHNRRSRRLRSHELNLKDKFSKLALKYGERKSRTASRRPKSDGDKSNTKEGKKKKTNTDKKLHSESEDDDDSAKGKADSNNKKRRRKKEILEESSLSEQSDGQDSELEYSSKKKSGREARSIRKKARATTADKNDPKFKANVFISLPLFKCEQLPEIYKRKKEIFEIKKLTNMDFTRRTRSTRSGPSNNSDDSDKPVKKRIKLTLKLNRKDKPDSDDERGSDEEVVGKDEGKKDRETLEVTDPLNVEDNACENGDSLAEACLEQIKDLSDKEDKDQQSEDSGSSNEDDKTRKKGKHKKKDKEKTSKAEGTRDSDSNSSGDNNKDEEPKVNGVLSASEEENDDEKDEEIESNEEDDGGKKKKGKKAKRDKLLTEKIDSSDSDDDFSKFSKKKDKTNSELVRKAKKRMKKSTVISDSDSDEDERKSKKNNKDSDEDEDFEADDKHSSDSGSGSEKEEKDEESEEETSKKPVRKRIKRVKDSSSDDDDRSTRKNLRRMIDRDSLSETTKKAEQDEKQRKSRISEKQKKYNQIFELKADATVDKVVLDFDEQSDKPLLSVGKKLAKQLKPHQVQGVKFMWDACFESLERLKKHNGSGCILAHCMGLGKTLQVITLVHTLLMNSDKTKVEKILVVCPVNTVLNWKSEFKKWLPKGDEFEIYELVSCKTSSVNHERNYKVREWHENGGVLIIGYNMFRTLSNPDNKTVSKKLRKSFHEGLVDPGPDLVVCDEGHLLKNEKTHLSIAMNRIKTLRRIVLTGTPLQNNLREYWCMVQFIKPNLLGTYKEYMNRFVNPITNGQYTDSTQHDTVVMRRRSHVLHKLLDGVVQRQDYSVLEPYLPPKYEYVLFLKLTEVQIKLYNHYLDNFAKKSDGSNRTSFLFTDFQHFQRICTHPRVLLDKSIEDKEKKDLNDDSESEGSLKDFIDDDESEAVSTGSESDDGSKSGSDASVKSDEKKKKRKKRSVSMKRTRVTRAQAAQNRENDEESDSELEILEPKQWWEEYIDKEELDNINHSAKIFLLFEILKECEDIGDKILVFSQSLYTLNCLEYFLQRIDEATQKGETEKVGGHSGSWAIGLDYFRLDGSSSCDNRASWCDQFNDPTNTRARLFLISTKAGGLGINLVAANRVIIFDVSWNPSHDIQSIYRVYRFGQTKPSYVYRFVTYGAMEMKIYERQVTKQAISKRVIDEQQIDRHYSQNDIQELYKADLDPADRPIPLVPKDVLLGEMLQKYDKTIFKYHEHQSLLENKQDEELNEEERKAAWDEFENEKVMRKTTVPNFAGVNMTAFQNSLNFSPQLIQVALANIVRKDNPTWSEIQIRGILPALVTQLQMQMSENDFSMYGRVQQEIRLMQSLQAQRMRENYFQQYQLQQMLQKQQLSNQMLGNMNISPEELRRLQLAASQNYIQPPPRSNTGGGGSADVIELND